MVLNAREFSAGLDTVAAAIDNSAVPPIRRMVRLQRSADHLALIATDLGSEIEVSLTPQAMNGWAPDCYIGAPRNVAKVIRSSGQNAVTLSPDAGGDGRLGITCGRFEITARAAPREELPRFKPYDETPVWSADLGHGFLSALVRLWTYMSREETRYYLNGVYLEQRQKGMYRLVATDGQVLGLADVNAPDSAGDIPTAFGNTRAVILPRVAVGTVLNLVRKRRRAPARLAIHMADCEDSGKRTPIAVWTIGEATLRTGLIDANYPDYEKVIPDNHVVITFDRAALRHSLDMLRTASGDPFEAVSIEIKGNSAILTVGRHGASGASTVLDCRNDSAVYEGGGASRCVRINPHLLSRLLHSLHGTKRVTLAFNQEWFSKSPIRVVPSEAIGIQSVIMPTRKV